MPIFDLYQNVPYITINTITMFLLLMLFFNYFFYTINIQTNKQIVELLLMYEILYFESREAISNSDRENVFTKKTCTNAHKINIKDIPSVIAW